MKTMKSLLPTLTLFLSASALGAAPAPPYPFDEPAPAADAAAPYPFWDRPHVAPGALTPEQCEEVTDILWRQFLPSFEAQLSGARAAYASIRAKLAAIPEDTRKLVQYGIQAAAVDGLTAALPGATVFPGTPFRVGFPHPPLVGLILVPITNRDLEDKALIDGIKAVLPSWQSVFSSQAGGACPFQDRAAPLIAKAVTAEAQGGSAKPAAVDSQAKAEVLPPLTAEQLENCKLLTNVAWANFKGERDKKMKVFTPSVQILRQDLALIPRDLRKLVALGRPGMAITGLVALNSDRRMNKGAAFSSERAELVLNTKSGDHEISFTIPLLSTRAEEEAEIQKQLEVYVGGWKTAFDESVGAGCPFVANPAKPSGQTSTVASAGASSAAAKTSTLARAPAAPAASAPKSSAAGK
jgi:hypothetical protein